jgi:signal transduction histidine kinase
MKEKLCIGIFAAGLLMAVFTGLFSLGTVIRLPSGQQKALEEYYDLEILSRFARRVRDFRRAGLNAMIFREEYYLDRFAHANSALAKSLTEIKEGKEGLGTSAAIDRVLADTDLFVRDYKDAVSRTQSMAAAEALEEFRNLIGKQQLDVILNDVLELDKHNYLAYSRYSNEIIEAAQESLLAVTFFEIVVLALITFSGVVMLQAYRRNAALLRQTEELRARLEEKNRELESLVRIVGHDLRAPLINIKGFSEEILKSHKELEAVTGSVALSPETAGRMDVILHREVPEAIGFITTSVDTLDRLIKGMVAAIKAGQTPIRPVTVDVNQLMEEILRDFDFRIKEAGARVHLETLPVCMGDRDQVRQVFSNLVDNAIKYREPSRPLELHIRGFVQNEQSVYCFEDNGIGMAEDEVVNVFNLYHQIKKMEGTGEGIGLATVKRMVEHNGGRVDAESELGRGSRFCVRLPAAK